MVLVCECLWFWEKIKLYQMLLFSPKRKYIEIRKNFIAYRPPPRVPTKAFACICVHIFCTVYESGVLAHGGGGRVVYGPKSNDRAGKNAVYV